MRHTTATCLDATLPQLVLGKSRHRLAKIQKPMRTRIVENLKSLSIQAHLVSPAADGDHVLNHRSRHSGPITPAAVLVPIIEREDGYSVLLTQRTAHLNKHAGQISFPGGRAEAHDADAVATALRETQEEIGLGAEFIEVVGLLDNYQTGTGFIVTPVVSFVRPGFSLALNDFEVAEAFEVPLDFIFEPRNHRIESRPWQDTERRYYALRYQQRFIWGATAGMLVNLYRRAHGKLK
jgi:8-oxo-dGTP pyrophosphatase MutT (NUDIX family)